MIHFKNTFGTLNTYARRDGFAANVSKLAIGTLATQIISVFITPIITLLYSPSDFGVFTTFGAIVSVLAVFATLRYELSIVLPSTDRGSRNNAVSKLMHSLYFQLIGLNCNFFYFKMNYFAVIKSPQIKPYLWLAPILTFILGTISSLNFWATRKACYLEQSTSTFARSFAKNGTHVLFGYIGLGTSGLVVGRVIGESIGALVLISRLWEQLTITLRDKFTLHELIEGLVMYRKFPLISIWSTLFDVVSWQAPVFLLIYYFDSEVVGHYGFGNQIVQIPISLFGAAVSNVFFQQLSSMVSADDRAYLAQRMFQTVTIIGFFPFALLTVFASDLFALFFSDEWSTAGFYVQILSVSTYFNFVYHAFNRVMDTLERQEILAAINGCLMIVRISAIVIGGIWGNATLAIVLFSASSVAVFYHLFYNCFSWFLGISLKFWFKQNAHVLFISSVIIGVTLLPVQFLQGTEIVTLMAAIAAAIAYYAYWIIYKPHLLSNLQLKSP